MKDDRMLGQLHYRYGEEIIHQCYVPEKSCAVLEYYFDIFP